MMLWALAALLITSHVGHAIPLKTCQQLVDYAIKHQTGDQQCVRAEMLSNLGCLCGTNGAALKDSENAAVLSTFELCIQSGSNNACNILPVSEIVSKYSVYGVQGVLSLPGFGMVLASALEDVPSVSKAKLLELDAADQIEPLKPVLDLSSLSKEVVLELASSYQHQMELEAVTEMLDSPRDYWPEKESWMTPQKTDDTSDVAFNVDIAIPKAFLEDGGVIDVDFEDITQIINVVVESDIDVSVTFTDGVNNVITGRPGEAVDGILQIPIEGVEYVQREIGSTPEKKMKARKNPPSKSPLKSDEITIEMDLEVDSNSNVHDAVITVRDEDSNYPLSGKEVGSLLYEIGQWLAAEAVVAPYTDDSQTNKLKGTLRGVSKLLYDVGAQVAELIPDQQLYSGQALEIVAEEDMDVPQFHVKQQAPCKLRALVQAASSVMASRKNQKPDAEACAFCAFVDQHLAVLWAFVVAGTFYVTYSLLTSFYQYLKPAQIEYTQEDDLQKPLILYASDFAQSGKEKDGFEPYCGPLLRLESPQ